MQTKTLKVVEQSEKVLVQSRKQEVGQIAKCTLLLREFGGEHTDVYVCTLFGAMAEFQFEEGQTVDAALRFTYHKGTNGTYYQDILINEIEIL